MNVSEGMFSETVPAVWAR